MNNNADLDNGVYHQDEEAKEAAKKEEAAAEGLKTHRNDSL